MPLVSEQYERHRHHVSSAAGGYSAPPMFLGQTTLVFYSDLTRRPLPQAGMGTLRPDMLTGQRLQGLPLAGTMPNRSTHPTLRQGAATGGKDGGAPLPCVGALGKRIRQSLTHHGLSDLLSEGFPGCGLAHTPHFQNITHPQGSPRLEKPGNTRFHCVRSFDLR